MSWRAHSSERRLYNILFIRRGVHDVVIRLRGIPHRKTVVVARRETDVSCPRGFDGRDPLRRVEIVWIERVGQLGVLLIIDIAVGHRPFARAEHGVKSPVEENAEFGVLKRRPGLQVFRRRGIGRSRLLLEAVQQTAAQAATIQRFFIVFGSDYILYSKVIQIRDNHAAFSRFSFRLLQSELFNVEKVTFYCDVRAQLSGFRSSFRPSLPRKQNRRLYRAFQKIPLPKPENFKAWA